MKILLQTIFLLITSVCMGCSDSNEVTATKPAAQIEQFTIQCGGTYYRGNINEETKVIRISGITSRKVITGVKYQLSGGASISPNPLEVKRWENEQKFTVTGSDNQTEVYTVLLPDLQYEPDVVPRVVIGYLPAGDGDFDSQFDNLHWESLTHINVSFAHVKSDGTLNTSKVTDAKLRQIRAKAQEYGVKVLISINKNTTGEFTAAIKNETSRNALAANIIAFTKGNQLDGFDIDYEEYDNWNANFPSLLAFIKSLHENKEESMLMTCAVVSRWLNYTTEWQNYFDYINLMSYDKGCYTETPVQHSSYEDFVADLNYWVNTCKVPKSKIVGGLPFYGYSWDDGINKDEVRAVRFNGVLKFFGDTHGLEAVADADNISKTYYNGRPTIRKKCQYIMDNDFGGVMIWQLFQDAYQEELKLINVVGEVIVIR